MTEEEAKKLSLCGYGCGVIGSPWVSNNPECPICNESESKTPFVMKDNETMGDYWRDVKDTLKEESQNRRSSNLEKSKQLLIDSNIQFTTKDNQHYIINMHGHTWDFWPSTGKWSRRTKAKRQRYSRGVFGLLKNIVEVSKQ
jgi:hypothetical protein